MSALTGEKRRIRNASGASAPLVPGAYVAVRVKDVPFAVRWSFWLFAFTIPLESTPLGLQSSIAQLGGLVFVGCYFMFYNPLAKRSLPGVPPALWCFLGYLAIYVASCVFIDPTLVSLAVRPFLTLTQLLVLFWISSDLFKDLRTSRGVLLAYAFGALYLAAGMQFGLVETRMVGGGRATVLGEDANALASSMALAVLILIGMSVKRLIKHAFWRIGLPVLCLPLLLGIVQTGSRTGMLTLAAGCLVYFLPYLRSKRPRTVTFLAICGVGLAIYLIATNAFVLHRWSDAYHGGDLATREIAYPLALQMISERPIFGWGPIEFQFEIGRRMNDPGSADTHNLFLNLLAEVGFVGSLPFLVGLWLCFQAARTGQRNNFGRIAMALLVAVLVVNMGIPAILWKAFWLFMAFALGAASISPLKIHQVRARFASHVGPRTITGANSPQTGAVVSNN